MKRNTDILFVILFFSISIFFTPSPALSGEPTNVVKQTVDQVLDVLRDKELKKPVSPIRIREEGYHRERANATNRTPNRLLPMRSSRPRCPRLPSDATVNIPQTEPIPEAVIRKPYPEAPTAKMSLAKIGNKYINDMPKILLRKVMPIRIEKKLLCKT